MRPVLLLEDPSYPGRSGAYVARITGKLMQEAALAGREVLFLPDPNATPRHFVYAGLERDAEAVCEVPGEFYAALFQRILGIFGVGSGAPIAERTLVYGGASFTFACTLNPAAGSGALLRITRSGVSNADT